MIISCIPLAAPKTILSRTKINHERLTDPFNFSGGTIGNR